MRIALKTGTYSLMHLAVAMTVVYAVTRDWGAALAIGLIEPAAQTVAYFFHERFWTRRAKPSAAPSPAPAS